MSPIATLKAASPAQVLERLSTGEPVRDTWILGLLNVDPLVVSRWLCGEDMRGVYQPIVLHRCVLDGLDLEGRTFYDRVELVGCRIAMAYFKHAYFYSNLLIEDCVFGEDFHGRGIQSDGRITVRRTVFNGWAEFSDISLRGEVDLVDVCFSGGTNLLHMLVNGSGGSLEHRVRLHGCRFRAADVPAGLEMGRLGIMPLIESDPRSMEG